MPNRPGVVLSLAMALSLPACGGASQPSEPRKTTISKTLWLVALQLEPERFGVFVDLAQVYALGPERRQFQFETVYSKEEEHGWRRMIVTYVRDCGTGKTFMTESVTYFWDSRPPSRIHVTRLQDKKPGQLLWDAGRFVCLADAQREAEKGEFFKFNIPLEDQESFVETNRPNPGK